MPNSSTSEGPSASARERAKVLLSRRLGTSKTSAEPDTLEQFVTDDSGWPGRRPDMVVYAETRQDMARALAVADEVGVPITPRAAGTGRSGGATTLEGGIVLSTLGMNQIIDLDIEEGLVVVGPGMVLSELHDAVEREGWFYPPDPNSASTCTIGGNVAENASGPRTLKYGPTRDYVLGLEAIMVGGATTSVGRRTKKGVTGYDVTALLVGSEGTLAVFDEIVLRLLPKPDAIMTLLVEFPTAAAAASAVAKVLRSRILPRSAELLDDRTLAVMRAAGHPFSERAGALLLLEVDGSETYCEQQAERIALHCDAADALDVRVAQSANQRAALWNTRRDMSHAVRKYARHKVSEDVVVPRQRLCSLLDGVKEIAERHGVETLSYGHAGDGNMHVNFLWDSPHDKPAVDRAIESLFELTVSLGGTLSGEHGIGATKAQYLGLEQSVQMISLQKRLKQVFDPKGLLNPGKIFPSQGHGNC